MKWPTWKGRQNGWEKEGYREGNAQYREINKNAKQENQLQFHAAIAEFMSEE